MAATVRERPVAPPPPSPTASPPPAPPESRISRALEAGAELSVVLLTATAAISLLRLFTDGSFLDRVLLAALAAHALAWAARRMRLGLGGATLLSAVGLLLFVAWAVEPHTLSAGLPLAKTWHTMSTDLRNAVDRFNTVVPPTPVTRGFVLASVLATWVCAFLADTAAFRLAATFEAVIPSFTMFLFGSVLAYNRNRLALSALYLASVLLFVLFLSVARRAETDNWLAGRRAPGSRALLGKGLAVGAIAVLVAVVAGPDLPGAGSAPVFNWRAKDNGPSSRTTISPLVDIRSRLVDQSDNELFTVQSSSPAYWRITALDKFDGRIWSSVGTYKPAGGSLPTGVRSRAPANTVTQRYAITGLSSIWLPAAFRPTHLDGIKNVRYDPESSSLLTDADTSNGLTYRVESALAQLTPQELGTAPPVLPQSIIDRYLSLPEDFPSSVAHLAIQVTQGATTPYAKAIALQNYLRTNYRYDLNVPPGHGNDALQRFLFVTKRGYCEQFAGSYAAMARAVNLPSRVAVGFTPGEQAADGTYRVLNRHAHAWPEVYLSGYGWVAFEPTPGRGAPEDQSYTGVVPMPSEGVSPPPAVATPETPTTTGAGAGPSPSQRTATTNPVRAKPTHGTSAWLKALLLLAVLVVIAGGAVVVTTGRRRRAFNRRRSGATGADARTLVAWEEAEEALTLAGYPRRRAETPAEYARRVPGPAAISPGPMGSLAEATAAAAYSAAGIGADGVAAATDAADQVRDQLAARATRTERLRWAMGFKTVRPPESAARIHAVETLVPPK
ncbi:MAG: transglutaminase domain-containing protein [Acidimicrobiia bacterium]|nr:transglutaminase domain-containing protein [Acidimicrobiia bacterium]